MYLLDGGKVVKKYRVAFGGNPKGRKEQEGDEKRPEGMYTLDYKKVDSSLYRAMHISYPNAQYIQSAKAKGAPAGGFLWIMVCGMGWGGCLLMRKGSIGRMVALH